MHDDFILKFPKIVQFCTNTFQTKNLSNFVSIFTIHVGIVGIHVCTLYIVHLTLVHY